MRASPSVLLVAVVLLGCSATATSPTATSPTDASPPVLTPARSAAPPASPSTEPDPTIQPTPEAIVKSLWWGEPMAVEGHVIFPEDAFASGPGTFVTVANTEIRFSADGIHWDLVESPVTEHEYLHLTDVVVGPLGVVAVGSEGVVAADNSTIGSNAVVLLSRDGRAWERIDDSAFVDGEMEMAGATREGFVVFGQDFDGNGVIWTSPDGRAWLRATNESGLKVAAGLRSLIPADDDLIAIVGPSGNRSTTASEFEVWRTDGRAEWDLVGRLVGGDRWGPLIGASGGGRSIVVGPTRAWTSTDGMNWAVGVPPGIAIHDVAAYVGGYIAVGGSWPADTCGGDASWAGYTWTSIDGRTWDQHRTIEGATISRLVHLGGTVLGLGMADGAEQGIVGVAWTSDLPESLDGPVPSPGPTPSRAPRPSSVGCG